MEEGRIAVYLSFMEYVEYPMVLFEKGSGACLGLNIKAQTILGKDVSRISIVPDKFDKNSVNDFWDQLERQKSILWYRIQMTADERQHYVSGIINEFVEEGKEYCAVLFESRGDMRHGSVTLERIINRSDIVAICMIDSAGEWRPRYISQNFNRFGYTAEQAYQGIITFADTMTPEECNRFLKLCRSNSRNGLYDFDFYTKMVTETKEHVPVRFSIHLTKDEMTGHTKSVDMLVFDLSGEEKEHRESRYLQNALNKSKSVVAVKRYSGGKRKLIYISQNAQALGINVDALNAGYRLSEDYIHPEDREGVLSTIYSLISVSSDGFEINYRMLGDDGKLRYVRNEVTSITTVDDEAEVEFLITDITEEKEYEQALIKQQEGMEQQIDYIMKGYDNSGEVNTSELLHSESMDELVEAISNVTKLCSVVVDKDGNFITKPLGPMEHLGEFYDMFERPFYREVYENLNKKIIEDREPIMMEMDDGNPHSRIAGAPIMLDDKYVGTWLMCCFSAEEKERLNASYRALWAVASHLSNYLYNETVVEKEMQRSRLNEMRLNQYIKRQGIVKKILENMQKDENYSMHDVLEKAGGYLEADSIVCFLLNDDSHVFEWKREWNVMADEGAISRDIHWKENENLETTKILKEKGFLMANEKNCPADIRHFIYERGVKTMILLPFMKNERMYGVVIFTNKSSARVWKEDDLSFATGIRNILQVMFDRRDAFYSKNGEGFSTAKLFAENVSDIVYIYLAETGEIVYANKMANFSFARNLEGANTVSILKHDEGRYYGSSEPGKWLQKSRDIREWDSYIRQLDKIMTIREINTTWSRGQDARLVIMFEKK